MNKITPMWDGPTKVVDSNDLSMHTANGWVILDQFDEEVLMPVCNSMPRGYALPDNHHNHYGDTGMVDTTEHVKLSTRKFLLGQPVKSAVAEAAQKVSEANNEKYNAEHRAKQAEKEFEACKKQLNDMENDRDTFKARSSQRYDEVEKEKSLRRKLELDMGKIRKHIGDGKWAEIVGA